jgi:hypothetical protein
VLKTTEAFHTRGTPPVCEVAKKAMTAAARCDMQRAMIKAANLFSWFYYFQSRGQRKERV